MLELNIKLEGTTTKWNRAKFHIDESCSYEEFTKFAQSFDDHGTKSPAFIRAMREIDWRHPGKFVAGDRWKGEFDTSLGLLTLIFEVKRVDCA
jgi:hypothetical protein